MRPVAVRWMVVLLMFAVAAVSYLDRNNISIAAGAIQAAFGLTNLQLGWVFSSFVLGYALCQPLAGRVADRFGPWRVVAVGLVWWSLFTAATALVPAGHAWSLGALMAVRLGLGVGESVIFPASNRLVAAWTPRAERGLANGVIFAGVGLGAALAPPLVTWLTVTAGWAWGFYASALIGLVALALWLTLARDRPEQHPWVSASEAAHIRAGAGEGATAGAPAPWRRILADRRVALLAASGFAYGYVAWIFFTWFFRYLSGVRGLDLKASALYGALPFLMMTLASPLGGWLADVATRRFGKRAGRCWTAAACLIVAAGFVALAVQVAEARTAALFLAGGVGVLYLAQATYWTLSADIGGRSAGSVSGVMNLGSQMGGVATASLTPLLADRFGWTASFQFAALLCLLGGVAWLFIDPERPLQEADAPRG